MIVVPYLLLSIILFGRTATSLQQFASDCGARLIRREPRVPQNPRPHLKNTERTPRIIAGAITKEGHFPWQASLELLHPSMGFLGHWCGAVLIHPYWVLSAAHCVHNDLFNLPIPPLWTVVLGEYDRQVESGFEQRIPVEKIVLHKNYENFRNDLVLMKLAAPANLTRQSNIRRICLPFVFNEHQTAVESMLDIDDDGEEIKAEGEDEDPLEAGLDILPEKMENFLRSVQNRRRTCNVTLPSMKELMSTKILTRLRRVQSMNNKRNRDRKRASDREKENVRAKERINKNRNNDGRRIIEGNRLSVIDGDRNIPQKRRRNDKLMKLADHYEEFTEQKHYKYVEDYTELPYIDCVATGWGKSNTTGDLTDLLLKTNVPLHSNGRCRDAYGGFVKIHRGHLCAGKLNGKGGTCVGDSGGPLQCRLSKTGPWILAGITSFGSGCAIEGFPDVYTRTSYYMKWIQDTIAYE